MSAKFLHYSWFFFWLLVCIWLREILRLCKYLFLKVFFFTNFIYILVPNSYYCSVYLKVIFYFSPPIPLTTLWTTWMCYQEANTSCISFLTEKPYFRLLAAMRCFSFTEGKPSFDSCWGGTSNAYRVLLRIPPILVSLTPTPEHLEVLWEQTLPKVLLQFLSEVPLVSRGRVPKLV